MLSNKRKGNFHISAPSLLWENLTQNVLGRLEWWLPHSDFLGLCLWHLLIIYLWFLRVDAMIALAYKWKVEAMLRAVWATYNKDEVVAAEWQWVWPRQAVFYSARTPCWKQPKCLKFFSRHVGVPFFEIITWIDLPVLRNLEDTIAALKTQILEGLRSLRLVHSKSKNTRGKPNWKP